MSKQYPLPTRRSSYEEDEKMFGKRKYTTDQAIEALLKKKPRKKRTKKARGK